MAVRHPCYRHHARGVWIAGCPDCTAWHRASLAATREQADGRAPTDARAGSADVQAAAQEAADPSGTSAEASAAA